MGAEVYIERAKRIGNDAVTKFVMQVTKHVDMSTVSTMLDIGSRDMNETYQLARIFDHVTFYAFEPNPDGLSRCRKRMASEGDLGGRMHLVPSAISEVNGTIDFYSVDTERSQGKENIGVSSRFKLIEELKGKVKPSERWEQKRITVPSTRLDTWMEANNVPVVDVIWMDAQGSEYYILDSAGDNLKNTKAIFTEAGLRAYYEGQSMKPQIDELLKSHGFEEKWIEKFPYEANVLYINTTV